MNIKIFLASSNWLHKYRENLSRDIAVKNKILQKRGIFLELVIWEDLSESMQLTRSQDAYNQEISKCDIFVLIVSNFIGKYSREEFEVAYNLFKNNKKPKRVLVYFEDGVEVKDKSLIEFEKELEEIGYFRAFYKNYDNLWNKLNKEIELYINEVAPAKRYLKHINIIPIEPLYFIGRDELLEQIKRAFFDEQKRVLMLYGNGGVGKTAIASKYYHKYSDLYSHLIWIMAQSEGIDSALLSLASNLKIDLSNFSNKKEQIEAVLKEINSLTKPILMVVDNADEYEDLVNNHIYLLKMPNIHILITSRVSNFNEFEKIKINRLSPPLARALFKHYYRDFKKKRRVF